MAHAINIRMQTHRSGRQTPYVEGGWKHGANEQGHAAYSINKHGLLGAVQKVIEARERSQGRALTINACSVAARLVKQPKGLQ